MYSLSISNFNISFFFPEILIDETLLDHDYLQIHCDIEPHFPLPSQKSCRMDPDDHIFVLDEDDDEDVKVKNIIDLYAKLLDIYNKVVIYDILM